MKKSLAIPFLVIAFALSACSSEKSVDKNMNDMKDKNISSNSMENKDSDNSLNLEEMCIRDSPRLTFHNSS